MGNRSGTHIFRSIARHVHRHVVGIHGHEGRAVNAAASCTTMLFALPSPNSNPDDITAGPDANVWFTEYLGRRIGRVTPAGVITEFDAPPLGYPEGIVTGPDGAIWFTEHVFPLTERSKIFRFQP